MKGYFENDGMLKYDWEWKHPEEMVAIQNR